MKKLYLPRVVAINDMSGYGKCALTVAITLLGACGIEVLPAPTALLSTNMKFDGFFMRDLTEDTSAYLEHWDKLGISADAIYAGFMSSCEQAAIVGDYMRRSSAGLKLVDPIMGDNGKKYKHFSPELCAAVGELCRYADIVSPNLTEAYLLTGREYIEETDSFHMEKLCREIMALGPGAVVITGAARGSCLYDCVCDSRGYREHETEALNVRMSGTGDMFVSILCGALLKGRTIDEGVVIAQKFIARAMTETMRYDNYQDRGVCYEPYLGALITEINQREH